MLHEPLFPLQWSDFLGFLGATVGLVLAAGGGIGGGGILVPIFILVLHFAPKHAIALSSCSVLGGSVANTILNAPKRHPLVDRPLISWDLILVMEPPTIAGALVGVLANKALPDTVIVVMLVVVLSLTSWSTLSKARKLYREETLGWQQVDTNDDTEYDIELNDAYAKGQGESQGPTLGLVRRAQSDLCSTASQRQVHCKQLSQRKSCPSLDQEIGLSSSQSQASDMAEATLQLPVPSNQCNPTGVVLFLCPPCFVPESNDPATDYSAEEVSFGCPVADAPDQLLLANIIDEERHAPRRNICIILIFSLVVLTITVLKGGDSFISPLGIQCGSIPFWIAEAILFCCIAVVSAYARSYLIGRARIKDNLGYAYIAGDIRWDERATCVYPSASMLAGFFAGMFGIGGGIVKGPLMLAMGVLPAVASATAACMILFTSFTATVSFVMFGLMITDYALFCFGMGFVATLIGQLIMSHLLRKYSRHSYIAFCIGIVVLLSAIFMTVESVDAILNTGGGVHSYTGLCSSQ